MSSKMYDTNTHTKCRNCKDKPNERFQKNLKEDVYLYKWSLLYKSVIYLSSFGAGIWALRPQKFSQND